MKDIKTCEQPDDLPFESLAEAIGAAVRACSQTARVKALKRVSRIFYFICRKLGMEKQDILSLATEIIDCFTEDIKALKKKTRDISAIEP